MFFDTAVWQADVSSRNKMPISIDTVACRGGRAGEAKTGEADSGTLLIVHDGMGGYGYTPMLSLGPEISIGSTIEYRNVGCSYTHLDVTQGTVGE